jgi:hypothetical protein
MKIDFIQNLNLESWDLPFLLHHHQIAVNSKKIRQENLSFSPEKTNINDSKSSSSQNNRAERMKESKEWN